MNASDLKFGDLVVMASGRKIRVERINLWMSTFSGWDQSGIFTHASAWNVARIEKETV